MKTMRFCILLVVIFATMLLIACGAPAAAPIATPLPPTAVPPTATPVPPAPEAVPENEFPGEYADVGDIRVYYEIHGEGEPLLLLHGGAGCARVWDWGDQLKVLNQDYMVIAPDSRAQGRTTDSDQPLTYQLMADDMVGLLDHLGIESAHVVGWSDGGDTGLNMAVHYPERVRGLVVTGAQYRADGMIEDELKWAEDLSIESFPDFYLDLCYRDIAPDPDHLSVLVAKLRDLFLLEEYVSYEGLNDISAPVLILEGEIPDFLLREHIEEMADAIPTASILWMPDVGHMAPVDKSVEWNAAVLDFLAGIKVEEAAESAASETLSGYANNDGVRIHYEIEGDGPPLMIVNWWTGSIEDWRMFGYVDGLKDDYQLILVDMRGHGQSDKPHEAGSYDPEIVVSDIIAVLDELDIDKTHYFGHSLSGTLGWALAEHAPERFHSFIISGDGPSSKDTSANADYLRSMTAVEWARSFEEATEAYGVWTPEIYDAYAGIDVDATALALLELNVTDAIPDLEDMQTPFLLIGVPSDDDYDSVLTAADRLPNVELYVSEQDHYGTGLLSDLVLPHITEFLEEVSVEAETPTAGLDSKTVDKIEMAAKIVMTNNKIPGAVVGVIKDDEIAYANGFGVSEFSSDEPVTSDSLFHMASITKTFVGTAIMQLVEEGKIDLDALVTEYLPCFTMADPRYEEITIRQLLSHTAGMPDVEDWAAEWRDKEPRYDDDALRDYACSFDDATLIFAPGEDWSYSSDGFEVLGAVVAEVSGQSFVDYIQEQVLTPLGMNDSVLLLPDANQDLLASPHIYAGDGTQNPEVQSYFPSSGIHAASGTLLSNVDDMLRYALVHLNSGELDGERILRESTYDEMWSPYVASSWAEYFGPQLGHYGMGWWVGVVDDGPALGGYGADPGFQSHLVLLPEKDMAIVAMVNLYDPEEGSLYAFELGNLIMESLLNE